ncbi:MAG: N-acetyl sugar amidotransferase [Proteobacteria bacterium]|nr:N-acetyl sugar amidotransferase [Pseudomonadota bacterium]
MKQSDDSFKYDVVLSLNSLTRLRQSLPEIERLYKEKQILSATLNHRFYDLHEKNYIKGTIEAHNLDHIMFSMRPSSNKLLSDFDHDYIYHFKNLSQLVFVLQCMGRYNIPEAIIASNSLLNLGDQKSICVAEIEGQILSFLDDFSNRFSKNINLHKQFCWLFSVDSILPKVRNQKLTFLNSFQARPYSSKYIYNDYQINNLEKNLFWVGFDPSFKDVPLDKEYPETKWTTLFKNSDAGKGIYEPYIRYCNRCCLPETMEGISFDEMCVCEPCRSSEDKMHIDWEQRRKGIDGIVDSFRSDNYYDCMLPMSGGKDSTYQAHILDKVLCVTPLAVTHGQNWLSLAGRYNLENCLQKFDLDHIVFNMNRLVINKMARKSIAAIGDACWHCHIGAGTFTIQTTIAWELGLMCWGESLAEEDGRSTHKDQEEASLLYNLEVSALVKAEDMADEFTSTKDLSPWIYPSEQTLKDKKIRYLHLGNYFFWDEERQVEFVKRNYEWMDAPVENSYKRYKSVECVMAGVHDYSNFIKRGIGRSTVQAAQDVRRGLLTREEGFEIAKKYDTQRPHALDFYLQLTGLSEEEFEDATKRARSISKYANKLNGVEL